MALPEHDLAPVERRRHKRYTHPAIHIQLDGRSHTTLDWSVGGFLIAEYDGSCRAGDEALVDLVIPTRAGTFRFTATVVIARLSRDGRQLAARFTRIAPEAVDTLSGLVTGRLPHRSHASHAADPA